MLALNSRVRVRVEVATQNHSRKPGGIAPLCARDLLEAPPEVDADNHRSTKAGKDARLFHTPLQSRNPAPVRAGYVRAGPDGNALRRSARSQRFSAGTHVGCQNSGHPRIRSCDTGFGTPHDERSCQQPV